MSVKPLSELRVGERGRVVRVGGGVRRRLLDMGVVLGVEVEVEKIAPLGDPIDVRIRGYHLILRKKEAKNIWVRVGV